jgi:uncharacterized protein YndB with AHSA1/START domain
MSEVTPFAVPPVVETVTVRRKPEDAFRIFTAEIGAWWPLARFHAAEAARTCLIEPRSGGRVYETDADGTETDWGRVRAWEPPGRLVFSWQVGHEAGEVSEVEVTFTAVEDGTEVRLSHSGWERLGERSARLREGFANGWETVFGSAFADYANR